MTTEQWQTWLDDGAGGPPDAETPARLEDAFALRLMQRPVDPPAVTVPSALLATPSVEPAASAPRPLQPRPDTSPLDLPTILKHMARRIAVARSAREVCQVVHGAVRRAIRADLFMVATFAPSGDAMRVEFLVEEGKVEPVSVRSPLPPLYRRVLHATSPVLLPTRDVILHEHSASLWQAGDPSPFAHSALFVPLRDDNRVIGFVTVQSYEPHAFSVRDIEWLSRIGAEAVPALGLHAVAFDTTAVAPTPVPDPTDDGRGEDDREARLKLEGAASVLENLLAVLERKDHFTRSHATRVRQLAVSAAEKMRLPFDQRQTIERAALLLDIGKIGLPDTVFHKNSGLTPAEIELVRQHTVLGETLARDVASRDVLGAIRSHHERWDGTGYPDGLAGADIPVAARFLAIVDSFVAMTSERSYRKQLSPRDAAAQLRTGAGSRYDPDLVEAFLNTQRDAIARTGGHRHWTSTFLEGKGVASL